MVLEGYTLDKGILVQGHGDKAGLNAVPQYDTANASLIFTRPWSLCFGRDGPGRDLARLRGATARLRSAIGDKRLEYGMLKAEKFISKDTNRISTDTRVAGAVCL